MTGAVIGGIAAAAVVVLAVGWGGYAIGRGRGSGRVHERSDADGVPDSGRGPSVGTRRPDTHATVLAEVVEHQPVGVVVADPTGTVVLRNRAARVYDGSHVAALVEAERERQLGQVRAAVSSPMSAVSPVNIEVFGPPRQVIEVGSRVLCDGWTVAYVQDVSESRRVDQLRTDFVANVSHELKTPVAALALLAETLAEEPDEASRVRLIERMGIEAERAGRTIAHIVELAEIETGPLSNPAPVRVPELLAAAADRVSALARHGDVEVEIEIDPAADGAAISGDRRQLESALGNLIENAVAYSHANGVVTVGATLGGGPSDGDRTVQLRVTDRGIGIPAEAQQRVFERFYRVDRARSRQTGGSGLGLSIVRRTAQAHHGTVSVQSTEGSGSTFVLELPVVEPTAEREGLDE